MLLRYHLGGMKPPLPPISTPEGTPFQKFDHLVTAVMAVSKDEIDKRERDWKRARGRKKRAKKS
jgi:hypothetical protein